MSVGMLALILSAGAIGGFCVLLLIGRLLLAIAIDAEETIEAKCERHDREALIAQREEVRAYEEALLLRLRAEQARVIAAAEEITEGAAR